jgi:hypothetical protein
LHASPTDEVIVSVLHRLPCGSNRLFEVLGRHLSEEPLVAGAVWKREDVRRARFLCRDAKRPLIDAACRLAVDLSYKEHLPGAALLQGQPFIVGSMNRRRC